MSRRPEIARAESAHVVCVDAWVERVARQLSSRELLHAFEDAFGAVWRRAHRTLGEITLVAIAGRTLYSTSEKLPLLSCLQVDGRGLRCEELEMRIDAVDREALEEATRRVLVELLTVIGNLTAEVLTPALHLELSRVAARGTLSAEGAAESSDPKAKR